MTPPDNPSKNFFDIFMIYFTTTKKSWWKMGSKSKKNTNFIAWFSNKCFKYQIQLYGSVILYLPLVLLLLVLPSVHVVWITLGHDKKEDAVSSIIIDLLIAIGPAMNVIKDDNCQTIALNTVLLNIVLSRFIIVYCLFILHF